MSEWHKKLDIPDPERKIGETPQGEPIWMDMRELIASPAEDEQRMHQTMDNRTRAEVDKAARIILRNAGMFIEQTFINITPQSVINATDPNAMLDYAKKTGFVAIQDGLKTVCKAAGKVIREMDAKVPAHWAGHIARRVNELVKMIPK